MENDKKKLLKKSEKSKDKNLIQKITNIFIINQNIFFI